MALSVVLLSAGYATRLYPLTKDRPKALLPLGEGVILDVIVDAVARVPDVNAQILVTNHRFADQFRRWQLASGRTVRILDDGTSTPETRLGAIRDLELARKQLPSGDDLLVIGTDNLFRWSLAAFVQEAQGHRPQPSVALWAAPSTEAATQFGVVLRDAASRISAFVEKAPQPPSREVALCVYYFPASMCAAMQQFIDAGGNADAPGYFIQWLVGRGAVYGVLMPGAWYDVGSLATYQTVVQEWGALRSS